MKNQNTPKDILMEIINTECGINPNIDIEFEESDDPAEEILEESEFFKSIDEFVIKFFENRFNIEIKQYNNDIQKSSDEFICRKNLELFRVYIEEIFPLEFEMNLYTMDQNAFYIKRKYLRNIHNILCNEFNNALK